MKTRLRFIKRIYEFIPKKQYKEIPTNTRGIYALLKRRKRKGKSYFNVVYIGMSRKGKGIQSRIRKHIRSKRKKFSHITIFEVKNKIKNKQIEELEGIFRWIYRKDKKAQRRYKEIIDKIAEGKYELNLGSPGVVDPSINFL